MAMRFSTPLLSLLFFSTTCWAQNSIDTVTFEVASERIVLDSNQTNNLWQIGAPDKTVFTSAFAGNKAIVTDTLLPYTSGDTSRFYLAFELAGNPYIEFKHRFDTDSLLDGGYVELSPDSGATWILVSDTLNLNPSSTVHYPNLMYYGVEAYNFYGVNDTLANAPMGFSGKSNGWITSTINFPCFALKQSFDLMLRFTFVSDSMGNTGDGWMIDNIIVYNEGDCGSIPESSLLSAQVFPNPTHETCLISLPSTLNLHNGSLSVFALSGQEMLRQDFSGNTSELQTAKLPRGAYQVLISEKGQAVAQTRLFVQ